jgi:hypothetical protein
MGYEAVLNRFFLKVYTEVDFVKRTYNALKKFGFNDENTIASVCICRDEITQSLRSVLKHIWGEAFDLSSLAGMFFAGKTGLLAAMHHAPNVENKERYVFYAMPHIAIDAEGRIGRCKRTGRMGESIACGALNAFHEELKSQKSKVIRSEIDDDDIEYSLMKIRLSKEIPSNVTLDLLELTKITQRVIQSDIESALKVIVDINKSDYAIITGIQINGPDGNYVWPASSYAIVNGVKKEIILS